MWIWESYADYITTGGSYLEYTSVTHYTYFKGTNLYDTDFNATTHNRVNTMTYNVKTVSTNIPDAIREDNTTPDSDWVYYGHLSYWRMSGDGTSGNMGGSWYGPGSYNDSNVFEISSSFSPSGCSRRLILRWTNLFKISLEAFKSKLNESRID